MILCLETQNLKLETLFFKWNKMRRSKSPKIPLDPEREPYLDVDPGMLEDFYEIFGIRIPKKAKTTYDLLEALDEDQFATFQEYFDEQVQEHSKEKKEENIYRPNITTEDEVETLEVPGFPHEIVRIGSQADGSCFFHSFLRATSPEYQDASRKLRKEIAHQYRKQIADNVSRVALDKDDQPDPFGRTYYDLSGLEDVAMVIPEFSISGIKKLLRNCGEFVGDEVLYLLQLITLTNVIRIRSRPDDIEVYDVTHYNPEYPTVIINATGNHYEAVAQVDLDEEDEEIYTYVFNDWDPFIDYLKDRFPGKIASRN